MSLNPLVSAKSLPIPSFKQWIRMVWQDVLILLLLAAVALGVFFVEPQSHKLFPLYAVDNSFAYPYRREIIPSQACATLVCGVPIVTILLLQFHNRDFWNANNALLGFLYGQLCASVFQVILKCLVGGLRPHFYDVCNPVIEPSTLRFSGTGFRNVMHDRSICTGDYKAVSAALVSFPSGHATTAFEGAIYLTLYLNAHFQIWSNRRTAGWKFVLAWLPLLGACLIAGSVVNDRNHNWYDVLAGAVIGTFFAFMSYRTMYSSCWGQGNNQPLVQDWHDE